MWTGNLVGRLSMVVALGFASALVGCGSGGTVQRQVEVRLDPNATVDNFDVHVVAVPVTEVAAWKGMSTSDYFFGEGGGVNAGSEMVYKSGFSTSNEGPIIIKKNDAIWKKWREKEAYELFVLAGLRGTQWNDEQRRLSFDVWSPAPREPIRVTVSDRGLQGQ